MPAAPRVTLVRVSVQVRLVEGDTVTLRLTLPANPPTDVTVIVEVPVSPTPMVVLLGSATTEKSGGGGGVMVTVLDAMASWPAKSVTLRVMVYVPGVEYVWDTFCPVRVDPSSNLQA